MNNPNTQTGRTERMLTEACRVAKLYPMRTFFAVFPTQTMADFMVKVRVPKITPDVPKNLHFIGMSRASVAGLDFQELTTRLHGEGTFDAFIDHSVVEAEIAKLLPAAHMWDAKPGEHGFKGDANG